MTREAKLAEVLAELADTRQDYQQSVVNDGPELADFLYGRALRILARQAKALGAPAVLALRN